MSMEVLAVWKAGEIPTFSPRPSVSPLERSSPSSALSSAAVAVPCNGQTDPFGLPVAESGFEFALTVFVRFPTDVEDGDGDGATVPCARPATFSSTGGGRVTGRREARRLVWFGGAISKDRQEVEERGVI